MISLRNQLYLLTYADRIHIHGYETESQIRLERKLYKFLFWGKLES